MEWIVHNERVIAPVTNRGARSDCWNCSCRPTDEVLDEVGEAARTLAYVVIANGRFTDLYTWGKRSRPPRWQLKSSTSYFPRH
ncbi:hypothetical protein QFZ55_008091 [Streptomyces luteogriseus]|nr:hypothetical protein [Streptomyces luteogriseus]